MTITAKRNWKREMMKSAAHSTGVGGRHVGRPTAGTGGGYPDICTDSQQKVRDPRVDDLRRVGLPQIWVRVADKIGFDAFLVCWQTIAADDHYHDNQGRVRIPTPAVYYRYLRNQWIRGLAEDGLDSRQIQAEMRKSLGQSLALSSINRIVSSQS